MIFWHETPDLIRGRAERRAMVERVNPVLPVSQRCRLLAVSRSAVYRKPAEVSAEDLAIMPLIDRQYLARPYHGSRRMAAWLAIQGHIVNRKRIQRLMRLLGLLRSTSARTRASRRRRADLPMPPRGARDRAGQSGVVLRRHLHPDGQGASSTWWSSWTG
jgi:putative transposase